MLTHVSPARIRELFIGPGAQQFRGMAASRLGVTEDALQQQIEEGLLPYLLVAQEHERVVPSPAVGALLDLAREYAPAEALEVLPEEPQFEESESYYLDRYEETCTLVRQQLCRDLDELLWPSRSSFVVATGNRYKSVNDCK